MDGKNKKEIIFYSVLVVFLLCFVLFFIISIRSEGLGTAIKNFTNSSPQTKGSDNYTELKIDKIEKEKFKNLKENSFEKKDFSKGNRNPFKPLEK